MIIFILIFLISLFILIYFVKLEKAISVKAGGFFITLFLLSVTFLYFGPMNLGSHKEINLFNMINESLELDEEFNDVLIRQSLEEIKLEASEVFILVQDFKIKSKFKESLFFLDYLIENFHEEMPTSIYSERAQILFLSENKQFTEKVNAYLEFAMSNDPDNPITLTIKGIGFLEKGNIEEAKNYWLKAIKNIDDPNEKEALQVAIDAIDLVKNQ